MYGERPGLSTLARGLRETGDLVAEGRRTASFYADPAAWLVVSAVEAALAEAPEAVRWETAEIGALAVSDHGTRHTMRSVADSAARGRVSPLRFAGANPGSLAGLLCITLGFRGPSLLVCMPPDRAARVVALIAAGWLATGECRYVAVAEHTVNGTHHTAVGRILGPSPGHHATVGQDSLPGHHATTGQDPLPGRRIATDRMPGPLPGRPITGGVSDPTPGHHAADGRTAGPDDER
ncbi:hypothetical protein [Nonomuraea guangzhouensis]|uniref:Coronafacic acid synthetase n=1 Tax=Nonomuraea guangzhouensis TaxID=1291555 RepID=A0ABW4GS46_9ACTN|nr:hypothetical protein [Nonomuraea guangzhouensis]